MKILIDNGHGADGYTNGKYSPIVDGMNIEHDATIYGHRFREGSFNRLVADELARQLKQQGYDAELIVTEKQDVPLSERVRRVNERCKLIGAKNALFISIHANAAGNGEQWQSARGFSAHVARESSKSSKMFAAIMTDNAVSMGLQGNRSIPKEKYWQNDFYVIRKTVCPAVLTENLFYDNKDDLGIIATPAGRDRIVKLHIDSITKYIKCL